VYLQAQPLPRSDIAVTTHNGYMIRRQLHNDHSVITVGKLLDVYDARLSTGHGPIAFA
jgi:hypothetical protein